MVAIDPRTGAIQAMVSMPSFDPNPLVAHDTKAAQEAYQELEQHPDRPLRNRALAERYPPGSVFKVIDAAAALEQRLHADDPDPGRADLPAPGDRRM